MCRLCMQNSVPDLYMCEIFAKKCDFNTYFIRYDLIYLSKCSIFVLLSMNDRNKAIQVVSILVLCICHSDFLTEICEILDCNCKCLALTDTGSLETISDKQAIALGS